MTTIDSALRAAFATLAIAATPQLACAAGLGPIKVFSGLGQNLSAEIEVSATATELQTLSARVASADAFRRAGLPFTSTVAGIELALDTRGERPLLRLRSSRPIDDPYVGLLVEIDWAAGNLAREYTFLLDPVELVPVRPQAPAAAAEAASAAAAATAAPLSAAPPLGEAGAGAARTHVVRRGETLHRIASAHLPRGVTLDQMLIALHRANRDAFEGDNINRLLADQRLVVPDAAQAQALSAAQASRAVRAQAADFEAYRRALASAAGQRVAPRPPAQQDSGGSIVARVEEAASELPQADRVQVSRSREALSAQTDGRLQALEEELAARERALEDSNERLGQLEQAVRDLQQLLELRASLPGQVALPDPASPPGEVPAEAAAVAQAPAAPEEPRTVPVSETEPRAEAAPAPVHPPAVAPAAEAGNGFLQRLAAQPLLAAGLGGLGALLLLGVGFVLGRVGRNRETLVLTAPTTTDFHQTVFARSGGQEVDTDSALPDRLDQAGALAMEAEDGVDPVAEADVYMAYGRDSQAEEILRDALAANPERAAIYLKLLEIHAQRGEAAPFEEVARALHERTGGFGWDWEKAAALGRRLDPGNPLYALRDADRDTLAPGTEIPTAVLDPAIAAGLAAAAAHTQAHADEEAPSPREDMVHTLSDLDFTSSRVEQHVATGAPLATQLGADAWEAGGVDEIELDLEGGDDSGAAQSPGARGKEAELDFDLGDAEEPASTQPAATQAPAELRSLADELDFDLPDLELDVPARDFDLSATVVDAAGTDADVAAGAAAPAAAAEAGSAAFDGELLDFDFDIEAAAPQTVAPAGVRAPAPTLAGGVDLSAIDLELDAAGDAPAAAGAPRAAVRTAAARSEAIGQAAQAAAAALDDVAAEVDTKLELAQAYEEMGDREGALELIEEVLAQGTAEQVIAALEIRKRLG